MTTGKLLELRLLAEDWRARSGALIVRHKNDHPGRAAEVAGAMELCAEELEEWCAQQPGNPVAANAS